MTWSARSTAARSVTGALSVTMIGMPTPTVLPSSGATEARRDAVWRTVVKVRRLVDPTPFVPGATAPVAVSVYVVEGARRPVLVHRCPSALVAPGTAVPAAEVSDTFVSRPAGPAPSATLMGRSGRTRAPRSVNDIATASAGTGVGEATGAGPADPVVDGAGAGAAAGPGAPGATAAELVPVHPASSRAVPSATATPPALRPVVVLSIDFSPGSVTTPARRRSAGKCRSHSAGVREALCGVRHPCRSVAPGRTGAVTHRCPTARWLAGHP